MVLVQKEKKSAVLPHVLHLCFLLLSDGFTGKKMAAAGLLSVWWSLSTNVPHSSAFSLAVGRKSLKNILFKIDPCCKDNCETDLMWACNFSSLVGKLGFQVSKTFRISHPQKRLIKWRYSKWQRPLKILLLFLLDWLQSNQTRSFR